ncbi:MAG: hypothetical protein Dbin4_01165, partial [Alphaproteobacteria bacterium]|nr:hypothetical protein [Alphaproteobacteria bacterium]
KTVIDHYEMAGDHLKNIKGYESYGAMQAHVANNVDASIEFFKSIQVYGTPEQCYERIRNFTARTGAGAYNGVFSYAGMPYKDAEASMRLFAKEVMPEVKKLPGAPLMDLLQAAE